MLWTILWDTQAEEFGDINADWSDNGDFADGRCWSLPLDDRFSDDRMTIKRAKDVGMRVVECMTLDAGDLIEDAVKASIAHGQEEEDIARDAVFEALRLLSERLGWAYYTCDNIIIIPLEN